MNVGQNIGFPLREHTHKKDEEIRQIVSDKLGMVGLRGAMNQVIDRVLRQLVVDSRINGRVMVDAWLERRCNVVTVTPLFAGLGGLRRAHDLLHRLGVRGTQDRGAAAAGPGARAAERARGAIGRGGAGEGC